ncbi:MAG: hypothetical protein JW829_11075, partial [Pirellulales bacterium]|nr:hypothetical protein [Pirellulales bacterium]
MLDGTFGLSNGLLTLDFTESSNENLDISESGGVYQFALTEGQWTSAPNTGLTLSNSDKTLNVDPSVVTVDSINIDDGSFVLGLVNIVGITDFGSRSLSIDGVGNVAQSGGASIGVGNLDIIADSVTLNDSSNDFKGNVSINTSGSNVTGNVTLQDTNAVVLNDLDIKGNLNVTSADDMTDLDGATITVGGIATFTAGTTITLANESSDTLTVNSLASFESTGKESIDVGVDDTGDESGATVNFGSLTFFSDGDG